MGWLSGGLQDLGQLWSDEAGAVFQLAQQGDPVSRAIVWAWSNGVSDFTSAAFKQILVTSLWPFSTLDPQDYEGWTQDIQRWFESGAQGSPPQPSSPKSQPAISATPQSVANQQQGTPVRGSIPSYIDTSVVDAVLRAARDTNVPYALALALVQQESGFNPNAHHVSSTEDSWGVAQLNTKGGEGAGLPDYILQDPYSNAKIAFTRVAQVMQQNPGADWGTIAALAQRPGDPTSYASSVNASIDQIQTGQGAMGWGLSTIRTGDPSYQANVQWGANPVPEPFNPSFFQNITQSFGQNGEEGTDFAMGVGQQITSPVGGKISLRDDGKQNWGKAVYVTMPNGWQFFVGHLSSFAVQDGETIGPGDVIGQSGGDPRDPSSGNSTGPHIEIRFIDPSGRNQDPMPYLQPIFSGTGTTFDKWMGGVFSGSAVPGPQKQNVVVAGDGLLVDLNTAEGAWYKSVDSAWTSIYGVHAPLQAARDFRSAGITTLDALNNAMANMPSAIPGVTIGAYQNVSRLAQSAANSSFGRAVPNSLIQQFFQQGITTSDDIKLWFDTHSSSDIPKADYQAIYDASLATAKSLGNDVPHPSDVASIYNQTQSAPANITPYSP